MIRLAVLGGLLEGLAQLSPGVQTVVVVGLLGLLSGVLFWRSDRPLERALKLIAALRAPRR